MPITGGQALALGNIARPDTTKVFTAAANRKQQLDLAKKSEEAKRKAEEAKMRKEVEGLIQYGEGGFDPLFQERANKIISQGYVDQMKYAKSDDRIGIRARGEAMKRDLQDLKQENIRFRSTLDDMERSGLSNKEISQMLNMRGTDAVNYYNKLVKEKPQVQTFLNLEDPTQGKFTANYIKNVGLEDQLSAAVKDLEKGAIQNSKKSFSQIGHTKLYDMVANPEQRFSYAMNLASDKDAIDNVKLLYAPQYNQAFKVLSEQAAKSGQQIPQEVIQQQAAAAVLDKELEKRASYKFKSEDWRPRKDFSVNLGGGSVTPNKWGLFPSQTVHETDIDKYKARNMAQLAELNKLREAKGEPKLTYDQAYPKQKLQYDEVVLENQDVSENKTFQYPSGKGGLIDVTPISIRRKKGTNEWELVGKQKKTTGDKTMYVDVVLPYSNAVRQKTDAILGANTLEYLNQQFGVNKQQSKPNGSFKTPVVSMK